VGTKQNDHGAGVGDQCGSAAGEAKNRETGTGRQSRHRLVSIPEQASQSWELQRRVIKVNLLKLGLLSVSDPQNVLRFPISEAFPIQMNLADGAAQNLPSPLGLGRFPPNRRQPLSHADNT